MTTVNGKPLARERMALWIREHGPAVRGYLFGMVRHNDIADDLFQEVFRRAWEARERYREQGQSRAYLLRIADRLVCDRSRKRRREITVREDVWNQHEPSSSVGEPSARLIAEESSRQLLEALELLTPPQKRVLLLRYYGNLEFREIARLIDCPLNTALSHCRRGLESLRKIFAEKAQ